MISNSSSRIHQTWGLLFSQYLYNFHGAISGVIFLPILVETAAGAELHDRLVDLVEASAAAVGVGAHV